MILRFMIDKSKEPVYTKRPLDKSPQMQQAQHLYQKFDVHEIKNYCFNLIEGTVCMEKSLQ